MAWKATDPVIRPNGQIIALKMFLTPTCQVCDGPMSPEDQALSPRMYDDSLCSKCFEWVGRTLVAWLDTKGDFHDHFPLVYDDDLVSIEPHDPFWVDPAQVAP